MSGIKLPSPEMIVTIDRIRHRIADEIVRNEPDYASVAHAALLTWAGLVSMDGEFTREHARSVANAVIDHYIVPRSN